MIAARLPTIAAMSAASLLAAGCYCPMLSGRYSDLGPCGPCGAPAHLVPGNEVCKQELETGSQECDRLHGGLLGLRGGLARLHLGATGGGQQGPDYVSPQARFHPVPTRPAFEPQLDYPQPELIEAADSGPPRAGALIHSH
jgi:hypothetical protein